LSRERDRLLALDLGDVRIGVALSDPLGITAQPAGVIERSRESTDIERIRELVGAHGVAKVVVGHPLLLSGEAGVRARSAVAFVARLQAVLGEVPVLLWDERLTTVQAERALIEGKVRRRRRKEAVDAMAATLILQSYLGTGRPQD